MLFPGKTRRRKWKTVSLGLANRRWYPYFSMNREYEMHARNSQTSEATTLNSFLYSVIHGSWFFMK